MSRPVVLDSDGLDALCDARPPQRFRAILQQAWARELDVLVPAVVCAEACRGGQQTRRVEATVARHSRRRGERPPVSIVATDFALARQVGAVLYGAGAGSRDMVDAHVVAICASRGGQSRPHRGDGTAMDLVRSPRRVQARQRSLYRRENDLPGSWRSPQSRRQSFVKPLTLAAWAQRVEAWRQTTPKGTGTAADLVIEDRAGRDDG